MLLCRVVCGELFRVESADPRLVKNSRTSGAKGYYKGSFKGSFKGYTGAIIGFRSLGFRGLGFGV